MKAHSVGLEIELALSEEEINALPLGKPLECLLNFRPVNSSKQKLIPLSLNYSVQEGQQIGVEQTPDNVYMGEARSIAIFLPSTLYSRLLAESYCGDRFGIGGRVDISKTQ